MSKRRKAWWIVGVVFSVVLYAVIAFLVDYNSTDARVERAVAQIVKEYGFEFSEYGQDYSGPQEREVKDWIYLRTPIDSGTADEIVAILSDACPSWHHEYTVYDESFAPVTISSGAPWNEVYHFSPTVDDEGRLAGVGFIPDDKGFGFPELEPTASLIIIKYAEPSLWHRIKGMWPW